MPFPLISADQIPKKRTLKGSDMIKHLQSRSRMSQAIVYGGLMHIAGQVTDDRKSRGEARLADLDLRIEVTAAVAAV
jgi:hypothetical protein